MNEIEFAKAVRKMTVGAYHQVYLIRDETKVECAKRLQSGLFLPAVVKPLEAREVFRLVSEPMVEQHPVVPDEIAAERLDTEARARTDDPDTSHRAAASITVSQLSLNNLKVLHVAHGFGRDGFTDLQLQYRCIEDLRLFGAKRDSTVRSARVALSRAGFLVKAGFTRENAETGQDAQVWVVPDPSTKVIDWSEVDRVMKEKQDRKDRRGQDDAT